MTRCLHTMYRISDPERSRAFYEALGLEFRREATDSRLRSATQSRWNSSGDGHRRDR